MAAARRRILRLDEPMNDALLSFIHDLEPRGLPEVVVHGARRCLLDLLGVAVAGHATDLAAIARDHATAHFGGGGARLFLDPRRVSPVGAAFANAATLDAFDAHDGHKLTKGHVGAAVLPALLAVGDHLGALEGGDSDDGDLLTALVVGYEVGTRAGMAQHRTRAAYHASGSWNAVACAAVGARLLGLSAAASREALGIAEYHAPGGLMMRCIDHPTMVKDSTAWGATAGTSAALLAAAGFTGAPAAAVVDAAVADLWCDLGQRWRLLEQYFKPYPVCRWAQPAVQAAAGLRQRWAMDPVAIAGVEIHTFHEATRLGVRRPTTTEQAQYSTPFPVACILAKGELGAFEITQGLDDPAVLAVSDRIRLVEDPEYNRRFPAERWARVTVSTTDGRTLTSAPTTPKGDPEDPLTDAELVAKFQALAGPVIGVEGCDALARGTLGAAPAWGYHRVLGSLLGVAPGRSPRSGIAE
ncbi:MAG: MmgE/PrpD family protein [Candidatus Competibacterales bacterium]